MGCASCGARPVDPVRGPSPWKRLVRGGVQVLVCPTCASRPGWDDDADGCPACGSTALRKALGVVRCSACGRTGESAAPTSDPGRHAPSGLSADVGDALDRLFGRRPQQDA